ncbi:MAG: UpxY family transcription antiterminator [Ilyomonas sp.]
MNSTFLSSWRVVYTKPKHEKKVADQLLEFNISSYLPLVKSLRVWHDRRRLIDIPLFPSYVFVCVQNDEDYFNSLTIDGLLYYVRTGKQIATVSNSVIDNIRFTVENGKGIEVSTENLKPGKQLLIKAGAFTGRNCEVVEYGGRQKIVVRIELLQRNILLNMPVEDLVAE